MPDLLTISGLWKSYTSVVLHDVHLALQAGEVHALVGENGAGKSTLGRIISGRTRADRGAMLLCGRPYAPAHPREAERRGVCMVMQELNLVGNLSVAENIFLNRLPHRLGRIDYRTLHEQAERLMAELGLRGIEPSRPVRTLGVGQQQLVEIAAGISRRGALLILDEPTAALTESEAELLFEQVGRLRLAGVAVLYISHRLEEIQRLADRITVLRDGRVVGSRPAGELPVGEIIRLMVGRELDLDAERPRRPRGELAVRVRGLCRGQAVRDVSFEAYRGEILGFAGLMGSGRTETMRLLFAADRADRGQIFLHGSGTPARLRHPRDAVRHGIALLTEDRKAEGLLLPLAIGANITLNRLRDVAGPGGWLRPEAEQAVAERFIRALDIRCRSPRQPARELSGGNQQKVILARWLFRDCDILIFDEPTRGIDIGARFEIYRLLDELAGQGKCILVVSSDLKELLGLCDRIAVMSAGRLADVFERGHWSQDRIMQAALSGYTSAT